MENLDHAPRAGAGSPDRTDKPQQIAAAACKLFLEHGYEVTSMDAIAAEAGVSKRTVYSHFGSKEQLFVETMHEMCEMAGDGDLGAIGFELAPEEFLRRLGRFVLSKVMNPGVQSVMRSIIAELSSFPEMGKRFWQIGPGNSRGYLADYLADRHARGELYVPDPYMAASQFQALVAGPQFLPLMFTGEPEFSADDLERLLDGAVAMFLAAHRPKN